MSDTCPVLLRMITAALPLLVVATIVGMPLPASAGSYGSCLGSCAIPSSANSPTCSARRAACANPSGSQGRAQGRAYGAMAYNATAKSFGESHGYASQKRAEDEALAACVSASNGVIGCTVRMYFYNTCAAMASYNDEELIGWAVNDNLAQARNSAVAGCTHHYGEKCALVTSLCSP